MPIHDWTRADAGDFHHFHQRWISALTDDLNGGGLPPGFIALAEQVTGRPFPDVVTLQSRLPSGNVGGIAIAPAPTPTARVIQKLERINYAKRADRVVIRLGRGRVVAIIEIVSPGNKHSRHAIRSFVEKVADVLSQGIHLVVVDLFPPTRTGFIRRSGLILQRFTLGLLTRHRLQPPTPILPHKRGGSKWKPSPLVGEDWVGGSHRQSARRMPLSECGSGPCVQLMGKPL